MYHISQRNCIEHRTLCRDDRIFWFIDMKSGESAECICLLIRSGVKIQCAGTYIKCSGRSCVKSFGNWVGTIISGDRVPLLTPFEFILVYPAVDNSTLQCQHYPLI